MMVRRRVIALAVPTAVAVAVCFSASVFAQQAKPNTQKRSKQEQAEIEQLVKLVDGVLQNQESRRSAFSSTDRNGYGESG